MLCQMFSSRSISLLSSRQKIPGRLDDGLEMNFVTSSNIGEREKNEGNKKIIMNTVRQIILIDDGVVVFTLVHFHAYAVHYVLLSYLEWFWLFYLLDSYQDKQPPKRVSFPNVYFSIDIVSFIDSASLPTATSSATTTSSTSTSTSSKSSTSSSTTSATSTTTSSSTSSSSLTSSSSTTSSSSSTTTTSSNDPHV